MTELPSGVEVDASLADAQVDPEDDLPMDSADATLVVLAEELGTNLVCTTDRRDFGVYSVAGHRRFRIVPDR